MWYTTLAVKNRSKREHKMKDIINRNRIKVNVNGREIEVYEGLTILQALLQEDIEIPHLCYDIRLERANGNCGLCVVELGEKISGTSKPARHRLKRA